MTELTLRRGEAPDSAFASLALLLKEAFSATALGIVLGLLRDKR